jgi:ribonucleoside-diphosphate reductase alpha chain
MTSIVPKTTSGRLQHEILYQRYLWKNEQGHVIETKDQMYHRVASNIAAVETRYGKDDYQIKALEDKFFRLMADGVFQPNSPTLMNAGRNNGMLSACIVLSIEDSINGIFDTVKNTALIQKAGGGTGFCFDKLRPTGDIVQSSGGKTSGPLSFLKVYSEATNAIQQGAFRRGANIGLMSIWHPDILKFIYVKQNPSALTNFNLSAKVTDVFMKSLNETPNTPHVVINPRTQERYFIPHTVNVNTYTIDDLIPINQTVDDSYTILEIWNVIVKNAHATGEPGICFIDRVNEYNPTPNLGRIEASNPCGEQPLLPYEACNLGSINVAKFVNEDRSDLNWDSLAEIIKCSVRFLDNVIDANYFPIPEIEKVTLVNRKIGLGIMGFADTLILIGIRYDNEEAVQSAEKLSSFIQENAHKASEDLAKERGCFPNWQGSIWDTKYHRPMRNAAVTTIAPTGTISLITGCSSGIEPIFDIVPKRRALDGQEFIQINPLIEELGTKEGWLSEKVRNQLLEGIPPTEISEIPKRLSEVLITAHQISPERHVRIQAAFQKYTDNAVSKTVNLPASATVEDVDKVYRRAYELRCKGITIYRDQSRQNQVITSASKEAKLAINLLSPRPRPKKTAGKTIKSRTGCGTLFITVNKDDNGLCEVFANLGKAGGCPSQSEATCRIISAALRCGVDAKVLIEQLKNIRCLSTVTRRKEDKDIDVLSCPDAIARAIEEVLGENCESVKTSPVNKCPECGHPLRREEGCNVCDNCSYRKCG